MAFVKARDYYPITGRKSTGSVFDRIPVEELQKDYPYQWSLFVLVQPPLKNSISLMEIGGIHGKPYREWSGDRRTPSEAQADFDHNDKKDTNPIPSRFGGYCNHTSVTFPTWHRPYVMLIEQAIGDYAENIAEQIANTFPEEGANWVNAARQLRFPYWDWAHPRVETEGFPSVFYEEELTIIATRRQMVTVPNPLSFLKFPYIPEDFSTVTRRGLTAYFDLWPQTFRRSDQTKEGNTNIDQVIASIKAGAEDMRTKVGMLFTFPDDGNGPMIWDQFSNTLNESRQDDDTTAIGALEAVHGSIHSFVAGFDPFFYFALWEWCYSDYWMENGYEVSGTLNSWTQVYNGKIEEDGEFGELVPWRREDGTYWTNNDARFLTPNAYPKYYSYKEFLGVKVDVPAASKQEQQEARARIAKQPTTFSVPVPGVGDISLPSNFASIRGFRLFVILARLPEHAFSHSYDLRIYYKETKLIGNVSVFAREDNSPCKACAFRRENSTIVRGVIVIPPRIVNEIIVESGIDRSKNTMEITTGLVTKALTGKLLDVSGTLLASAQGGDKCTARPRWRDCCREATSLSTYSIGLPTRASSPSGWKAEDVLATTV
ncbi:common central domain of tyrosinase-domain-containing protein [Melanogaster broomeanus]|nr:common central domain of tyrosinase-domain-containing protein [Melanogaster broomeanus]